MSNFKPRIDLIVPHRSEFPVALPFARRLMRTIGVDGDFRLHRISKTRVADLTIRRTLQNKFFDSLLLHENGSDLADSITQVLKVYDAFCRASAITSIRDEYPNGIIVEVHGWLPNEDAFANRTDMVRQSDGLVLTKFDGFSFTMGSPFEMLPRHIAKILNFDLNAAMNKILLCPTSRVYSLEVPASRAIEIIKKNHPLYHLFYDCSGRDLQIGIFERAYILSCLKGRAYRESDLSEIKNSLAQLALSA